MLVISSIVFFLMSAPSANAENAPSWPFGSGCSSKEIGKTKSNGKQVCIKQGSSYKWVATLTKKDVYDLSAFCSTTIKSESSGAVCGWNEKIGLKLVSENAPRDLCIEAFRKVVYFEAEQYVTGRSVYVEVVTAGVKEIFTSVGCKKWL